MPDDGRVPRAPRLDANDDSVTLARWLASDRATVAAGEPIAEIDPYLILDSPSSANQAMAANFRLL